LARYQGGEAENAEPLHLGLFLACAVGQVAKKELELHFKKSPGGNRLRRFLSPESGTASDDAVTVVHIDDRPPSLAGASADGASSLAGGVGVLHLASLSSSRAQTISGQEGTGLSLALRPPQRSHPEVQAELEVLSNQILQPWKVCCLCGRGWRFACCRAGGKKGERG